METPEQPHRRRWGDFIDNFEQISPTVLASPFLKVDWVIVHQSLFYSVIQKSIVSFPVQEDLGGLSLLIT